MMRLWLAAAAVATCCVGAVGGTITCAASRAGVWDCPAQAVNELSMTPTQRWFTLAPTGAAAPRNFAKSWVETEGFCCKHCVWDLGYPLIDPIILASDRTSTMTPKHLDCTKWAEEFAALDADNDRRLSAAEMDPWLNSGTNKFLTGMKRLDRARTHLSADFNRDGAVALEEWNVLRHFWAPVELTSTGPLPENSNVDMQDGPLGGLFWDINLVEVFMNDVNNILLEQVSKSKAQDCWWIQCYGNASSTAHPNCSQQPYPTCYWDSSYVREFNAREQNRIMRSLDLDGSGRVSIEEHYFRYFADIDRNGVIDEAEYALSLYAQGEAPVAFGAHDLNQDSAVTFLERKFVVADMPPADNLLTKSEWIKADLPEYFGPFEGHKIVDAVDKKSFTWYTVLHTCALQGVLIYQVSLSEYPWAPSCTIVVSLQTNEPWVGAIASGQTLRREGRRQSVASSYLLEMFKEATLRLKWNTRTEVVAADAPHRIESLSEPPTTGSDYGTVYVGLYSAFQELPSDDYVCTRSFAPSHDGFAVVVRSQADSISLTAAVLIMVVSPSFLNFASFLFIALIVVGHVYWALERKENSEQFNPAYARGIMDSAWFCIVTMSTVGYGDKVPATGLGKAMTVFWMLFGILNFGIFTGQITSQINFFSAEAAISDVNSISNFDVGIYASTDNLRLDAAYQFNKVLCEDMADCANLLETKQVSALLVPKADVLTYFVKESLSSQSCGNPLRIVGEPILVDEYPSVKMCSYSRSVYAAVYLKDALDAQIQALEEDGFAEELANVLQGQVEDTSDASNCEVPLEYELRWIIPAAVTIFVYWLVIAYINHRKRVAQGRAIRSFFGQTQKTPEQLALYYGLKWKAKARQMADAREKGREVGHAPYKPALNHDDRLLNFLTRVRVLSSGHTHDLQRCQKDVDAVCTAINIAKNVMFITVGIMLGMVATVVFSLWSVANAKTRYLRLD